MIREVNTEGGVHRGTQLPVKGGKQVVVQEVSIDAHVVYELGYVSTLPGEHHLRGRLTIAEHISSQARTDSQARVLACSREPQADPSAVVPQSEPRMATVSWTYGVCHPPHRPRHAFGRTELLTLPSATQPKDTCQRTRAVRKPAAHRRQNTHADAFEERKGEIGHVGVSRGA